jgi:hypothetical protein
MQVKEDLPGAQAHTLCMLPFPGRSVCYRLSTSVGEGKDLVVIHGM